MKNTIERKITIMSILIKLTILKNMTITFVADVIININDSEKLTVEHKI